MECKEPKDYYEQRREIELMTICLTTIQIYGKNGIKKSNYVIYFIFQTNNKTRQDKHILFNDISCSMGHNMRINYSIF